IDNKQAAELIYNDGIDVLVDLGGHTGYNRLPVFTYKPAPVQVCYLGYLTTTGLSAIDYWLVDEQVMPLDSPEQTTEAIYRLPRCWVCYQPSVDAPEVKEHRASGRGITFGSFNHLGKLTPEAIKVWSEILLIVPDSTLLMKTRQLHDPYVRQRITDMFTGHGVKRTALNLIAYTESASDHFNMYNQVDICLDTFPFTGGTTTADALWMGVPVITLVGERFVERMSTSMLRSVGLEDLITYSTEDYINRAVELAKNHQQLEQMHSRIRQAMAASELCDAQGLAEHIGIAFLDMHKKYLKQEISHRR
ncbi:MAG: hypothetical protein R8K50_03990, partial [Mariprofundus sp.]